MLAEVDSPAIAADNDIDAVSSASGSDGEVAECLKHLANDDQDSHGMNPTDDNIADGTLYGNYSNSNTDFSNLGISEDLLKMERELQCVLKPFNGN